MRQIIMMYKLGADLFFFLFLNLWGYQFSLCWSKYYICMRLLHLFSHSCWLNIWFTISFLMSKLLFVYALDAFFCCSCYLTPVGLTIFVLTMLILIFLFFELQCCCFSQCQHEVLWRSSFWSWCRGMRFFFYFLLLRMSDLDQWPFLESSS